MNHDSFSSSSAGRSSSRGSPGPRRQSPIPTAGFSREEAQVSVLVGEDSSQNIASSAATIVTKIECLLEDIVDALTENSPLTIPLRSRKTGRETLVLYPTASATGARRFTALLIILYQIHEALVSHTIITKRHIFYQDKTLFVTQNYVDQMIDDIAFSFGVSRDALNIVATPKGLVVGGAFQSEPGKLGVTIPQEKELEDVDLSGVQWVLVIEKDATFRNLAAAQYFAASTAGPGLLVTVFLHLTVLSSTEMLTDLVQGKGFPDLATRQFLYAIHVQYPHIPIHALVDFDPAGIGIMRTYQHGSQSLRHEKNVTVPELLWLGVKSNDVFGRAARNRPMPPPAHLANIERQSRQPGPASRRDAGIATQLANVNYKTNSLTDKDRRQAVSLLRALENQGALETGELNLCRELQFMLILNIKFEIQAVDDGGNMAKWLDERLSSAHGRDDI
ncbi:putative Spo11/DNA topoisomerase VI subunit A [Seiridium cardinale]|uniref:DNA topoisomerase (ATP-hydrolyzing) n=1 Tax=Seiridium cardinale TaxID=138064 RepID=A0ABR2Y4Y5_9PEZI